MLNTSAICPWLAAPSPYLQQERCISSSGSAPLLAPPISYRDTTKGRKRFKDKSMTMCILCCTCHAAECIYKAYLARMHCR